jgi:hypothetical protein
MHFAQSTKRRITSHSIGASKGKSGNSIAYFIKGIFFAKLRKCLKHFLSVSISNSAWEHVERAAWYFSSFILV